MVFRIEPRGIGWAAVLLVGSTLGLAACGEAFSSNAAGGNGGSGGSATGTSSTTTATDTTGTDTTGTNTTTGTTGTAGGGGSTTTTTSTEGGAAPWDFCAHPQCDIGLPLDSGCDNWMEALCFADPFCCDVLWDAECVRNWGARSSESCAEYDAAPDCLDQYPDTVGFELCGEALSPHSCHLSLPAGVTQSCTEVCGWYGGACYAAYSAEANACSVSSPVGCGVSVGARTCRCSRGCGARGPCVDAVACVNGSCENL